VWLSQGSSTAPDDTSPAPVEQVSQSPLEAVIRNSLPSLGQIVLGTLCFDGAEFFINTPSLGRLQISASLVALNADSVGRQVALSLSNAESALVLGLVWEKDQATSPIHDLRVDGEHHVIEAQHSIELRCGEAAIVLLADGRIQLRGTYITSHATATQRIVGGSVHVN
jgi:hypothetical protein